MTGKTHVTCGYLSAIALGATVGLSFNIGEATVYPIFIGLMSPTGSLLPDIDLHRSTMGRKYPIFSKLFTHRGITHTLLFPILLGCICGFALPLGAVLSSLILNIFGGLLWGWIIHILADMCNKKGVPILWPLSNKRIHVASFLTSSWQEGVFVALCAIITFAYTYARVLNII